METDRRGSQVLAIQHHRVVVVGGGNAGISVAAQLKRTGVRDIAIIEPSDTHYYQPLWTLVGGGCAPAKESRRPQSSVMPKGVRWIKDTAEAIEPERNVVQTRKNGSIHYDYLVMAAGLQLDWDAIPGMRDALQTATVSSNYDIDLAEKTWRNIQHLRSGRAVFTMPSGPIKCAGAPQKIAYLAADYWRQQGVLDDIEITLVLPTPGMFGVPVFANELVKVAQGYGIDVKLSSEMIEIRPEERIAVISDNAAGTQYELEYDMMHVVPPQSAPDWVKASPLADPQNPHGYMAVDQYTLQHPVYDNVFGLGDVTTTPNAKTGAAVRKQAPVLVKNLLAQMANRPLTARYSGYGSCPLTTARNRMLLAEFDYNQRHTPSIPLLDTTKPRYDMWLLKRRGLPFLYWNSILKGRA